MMIKLGLHLDTIAFEKYQYCYFNPYRATHNYNALCKQLGSGWEAKLLGVSPGLKLFDTQTF